MDVIKVLRLIFRALEQPCFLTSLPSFLSIAADPTFGREAEKMRKDGKKKGRRNVKPMLRSVMCSRAARAVAGKATFSMEKTIVEMLPF